MAAIVGDLAAAEEIKALKDLMTSLGVANLDCRQDGAKLGEPAPILSVQHDASQASKPPTHCC